MQKAAIAILMLLLLWMGSALVRVENERYALFTRVCHSPLEASSDDAKEWNCLRTAQTRKSWVWHLYFALMGG